MARLTLQFSTTSALISRLIRWMTRSDFSHVDLIMPDGQLLGAHLDGGVAIRPSNYCTFTRVQRAYLDIPDDHAHVIYAFARSQVGKSYDTSAIYGFVFKRDWQSPDKWFCSELVEAALEAGGEPLVRDSGKYNRISPRDLLLSPRLTLEP